MDQKDFSRRILLAVTGLSPQVVTETLYALKAEGKPVPTEVRLITTKEGRERASLSLLHPETGWFHRFRADYDLPEITFDNDRIHVLETMDGQLLEDIRTLAENTRAADAITEFVCNLKDDNKSALYVSIAGGRKTMGFYLGYALSLYGRPQDRLSHVLVSAPFESHPDFFYPSPRSEVIYVPPDNRPCDKREAKITLAEIPFVRMRDGLNADLLEGRASFSEVVAEAQRAVPPLFLELAPETCTVNAGGESFRMQPSYFALYWMMTERARSGKPGLHWSENIKEELLGYYGRLVNSYSGSYDRAEEAFRRGVTKENFDPAKAHVKKHLERHLGRKRAEPYLIKPLERIPDSRYSRYGLALPPQSIQISNGVLSKQRIKRRSLQ
ncbi:MAG: TIGR02584 family CRISPR-associated protein [Nitrospira sp. SB0673_bin_12]|nr:TIGR02584 family CRISPR-associated protein [Nitrospira sp. SB0673_bin_12]